MNNLAASNTSVSQDMVNHVRQSMDRTVKDVLASPGFTHQKFQRRDLVQQIDANLSGLLLRVGILVVEKILQTEEKYGSTIFKSD